VMPQQAHPVTGRLGLFRRRRNRSGHPANQQSTETPNITCPSRSNSGNNFSSLQRSADHAYAGSASTSPSNQATSSSNPNSAVGGTTTSTTEPASENTAPIAHSTVEMFCSYLMPSSFNDGLSITQSFAKRQRSNLSWILSEVEERAYVHVFDAWDETGDNTHVSGNKAVEIFDRADLGRDTLAQIWFVSLFPTSH
jgi:hypothetical protein